MQKGLMRKVAEEFELQRTFRQSIYALELGT